MDKYDKALASYKRRERKKRILVVLCITSMGAGFVLGIVFCLAVVNMFA